jgi:pimeloyl-ACP methyl ester carboxylesterase
MRLHFRSYGHGEPLIILHGLFGSLENWHSISLKLSAHFQVFAVDQRNHGQSPHSPEMNYELMAGDLEEFITTHRLPPISLMGHSMGGKTAMQFAMLYPALVNKLIVVDMAPGAAAPRHEQILRAMLSLNIATAKDRCELEQALAPAVPELATRQFLLKNLKRQSHGAFRWQIGLQEIQQNYAQLSHAVGNGQAFDGPVLFLRGESSTFLVEHDLPEIRRLFPKAELWTVSRAGHLPHVENTTEFVAQVRQFLTPHFYRQPHP